MLSAFGNVFRTPDLRKKLFFTLFILLVFRIGATTPTPNVNLATVNTARQAALSGTQGGLYSLLNLFSGGALLQLSVFALGIMPYITSSIILQLLTVVVPRLEALKKEGAAGTAKITQYTRILTIFLGLLQATGFVTLAVNGRLLPGYQVVYSTDLFSIIVMVLTMTAGSSIIMWMGELVSERGIGNGMSIMIFTQIAAAFPAQLWGLKAERQGFQGWFVFFAVIGVGLLVMLAILFVEQAQRRIPVQYAKRMVGKRLVGGTSTYIPVKVNQSGVIPVIFASSLLYIPVLVATFFPNHTWSQWISANFATGTHWVYNLIFFLLIIGFCYFYISITFNPVEISDNMKKYGGFIPGIRAGKPTEDYLGFVLSRLTAPGSLYLAVVALLPSLAFILLHSQQKFPFGGTSILIIVGVGLDTVKQIQSQLQQRNYEGFLR